MPYERPSLVSTKVIVAGLLRKAFPRKQAFGDISVFLWLRKQQLRFAQGQPKHFFQMKEVDRTTDPIARMNVEWKVEKAQYAEFKVPICGKIAICQPCRDRQIQRLFRSASWFSTKVIWHRIMAWIWHVLINAMVFVSMAQAPPKAGAKELFYSLRSKFVPWVYILFFDEGDLCRFAQGKPSCGNRKRKTLDKRVFLWLHKQ